eukprot:COSAG01_NODE_2180_length_8215_cov_3.853006_11_plen_178_part_00
MKISTRQAQDYLRRCASNTLFNRRTLLGNYWRHMTHTHPSVDTRRGARAQARRMATMPAGPGGPAHGAHMMWSGLTPPAWLRAHPQRRLPAGQARRSMRSRAPALWMATRRRRRPAHAAHGAAAVGRDPPPPLPQQQQHQQQHRHQQQQQRGGGGLGGRRLRRVKWVKWMKWGSSAR